MNAKTVPVTLPEYVWGRLATIAEHRGVMVADLIGDGIMRVLDADPDRLDELTAEMSRLRRAGYRARRTAA